MPLNPDKKATHSPRGAKRVLPGLAHLIFGPPWPSNPCFFLLEKKGNPAKSKGLSLRGAPVILGKEGENAQKMIGKSGKKKNKKSHKSKDWRVRAHPKVRLGLSGGNSRKFPERPWKRSQSFSSNSPQDKSAAGIPQALQWQGT